jgi:phage shock protein PspC (stress-responsive transcriptional regulator)
MIAGVATGMADAFHIDVVVMRVIWVVVALASFGVGVAAYALCWLAFPSDEHPAPLGELWHGHNGFRVRNAGYVVGLALLGVGLIIAFGEVFRPFRPGGSVVWATVLIGGGLAVLCLHHPDADPDISGAATTPSTSGQPVSGAQPEPAANPDDVAAPSSSSATPTSGATATVPPIPPSAWTQSAPWPVAPTPRTRRARPRAFLTPLTCSVLLIGAGVVTLLDDAGTTHLTAAEILAGALCIVGGALVLSTWFGRARGLVPLGIVLLIATIPAATIDVPLTGGTGYHHYVPTTRAELRSTYEMGIGRLDVDLREVPLLGRTTRLRAQLGIGNLVVDVPSTVTVVVSAHAGAGAVLLFGANNGGWPAQQTRTVEGTRPGELDLDLRVGAGAVQVHRFDPNGAETIFQEAN